MSPLNVPPAGSPAPVPRPARLGRLRVAIVLLALLLAVIGPPAALAQNVGPVKISYHAEASLPPAKVCVGDSVSLLVRVGRDITYAHGSSAVTISQRQTALWVNGTVQDPAIGRLRANRQLMGFDLESPREVEFQFIALAAGSTKVSFAGEPPDGHPSAPVVVDLKVEVCQLQVTSTSPWAVPGEARLVLIAKIKKADLVAESSTHFSGVANVTWLLHVGSVVNCVGDVEAGVSTAVLVGDVNADNQVTVKVTYLPAEVAISAVCVNNGVAVGDRTVMVTPDPVTITVPASGGYDRLPHGLDAPSRVEGEVVILVLPVAP